jgi:hypothetical protein
MLGHVSNFETLHQAFVEQHGEEFANAGFSIIYIVSVTINRRRLRRLPIKKFVKPTAKPLKGSQHPSKQKSR